MDEGRLREALVAAGGRLGARRLVAAGEGNASVRLDAERLLITPAGRRKDELDPADAVVVPARADARTTARGSASRPSSDLGIHRTVYAARPDVAAVVHAHVPAAMALTIEGEVPDPAALPETALLLPRLPIVSLGEPGSEELARRIGAALGGGEPPPGAVLLEGHGAVAVGEGPDAEAALVQAVDRIELVDVLCRVWRDALLIRAARRGDTGDEPRT